MSKPSENKVVHNDQVTGPVGKWDPAKKIITTWCISATRVLCLQYVVLWHTHNGWTITEN